MTPELLEELLAPISAEHPAGSDVAYSLECDEIRKLRKGDDASLSQGQWVREIRAPQWPRVLELCQMLLKTQGKDLQVACWHAEALTRLEGFAGLDFGLKVIEGVLSRYWETCYPSYSAEDPEERIAKFEWLNTQLLPTIQSVPMTSLQHSGYSKLRWDESRIVENLGAKDPRAKEEAIAEGKLSGEAWDKAAMASGPDFYTRLFDQVRLAQQSLEGLEQTMDARLGVDSPGLEEMKKGVQGCMDLAGQMLKRHGVDPGGVLAASLDTMLLETPATASPVQAQTPAGPIQSRTEAIRRLREVAKYFRENEPHSPVAPLVERAARWGEMPLDLWLTKVIKDDGTLRQLRELLDLQGE